MEFEFIITAYYPYTHAEIKVPASLQGDIVIALDTAGIRPLRVSFTEESGEGKHQYTFIRVVYEIKGRDHVNILANSFRFYKENVQPCMQKCIENYFDKKHRVHFHSCEAVA